jgi:hypothetical protein
MKISRGLQTVFLDSTVESQDINGWQFHA